MEKGGSSSLVGSNSASIDMEYCTSLRCLILEDIIGISVETDAGLLLPASTQVIEHTLAYSYLCIILEHLQNQNLQIHEWTCGGDTFHVLCCCVISNPSYNTVQNGLLLNKDILQICKKRCGIAVIFEAYDPKASYELLWQDILPPGDITLYHPHLHLWAPLQESQDLTY
jgi:hypothetical protein